MISGKIKLVLCVISLIFLSCFSNANAQADPRQLLVTLIGELQTGTPNPALIGPQLWQTIAMQTSNTGYYAPLANLGAVTNISVVQQIPLPQGWAFVMTVQHQNGQSAWQFAISQFSGKIEYASFNVNAAATPIPTQPAPDPAPGPAPIPTTPTTPTQPSSSPACTKFPDLC